MRPSRGSHTCTGAGCSEPSSTSLHTRCVQWLTLWGLSMESTNPLTLGLPQGVREL